MCIKALIPVRSGSVRVKNKNIRPFAGSSLLEIKIKQMKRIQASGLIDGVVVNSNCDEMLALAKRLGAECVKREEKFATSEVSPNDFYRNIAQHLDADNVLLCNCTNPLVSDQNIIDILGFWSKNTIFDTINSVHYIKEFLWMKEGKNFKSLNYDPKNIPRSQDLDSIIALNFAINISSRSSMIDRKSIVGDNPYFWILDNLASVDIDDDLDFKFAEFLFENTPPPSKTLPRAYKRNIKSISYIIHNRNFHIITEKEVSRYA